MVHTHTDWKIYYYNYNLKIHFVFILFITTENSIVKKLNSDGVQNENFRDPLVKMTSGQ